jgi:hypothetical protein
MTKAYTEVYQIIVYENTTGTYICKAPSFATANSALWQIKFIDQTSSNFTRIRWADGNQYFDNIAQNYLSLTYQ